MYTELYNSKMIQDKVCHPLLDVMNENSSHDDAMKSINVSVTNELFISTSPFRNENQNLISNPKFPDSLEAFDHCLSIESKSIKNSSEYRCNSATYFSFKTFSSESPNSLASKLTKSSPTESMINDENNNWIKKNFYDIDLIRLYNSYEISSPKIFFNKNRYNEKPIEVKSLSNIEMIEIYLDIPQDDYINKDNYSIEETLSSPPTNQYKTKHCQENIKYILQKMKGVLKMVICIW